MGYLRLNLCVLLICFLQFYLFATSDAQGRRWSSNGGVFPPSLNLAANSVIIVNATCGELQSERFCKLADHAALREPQCGVCSSARAETNHPIRYAIDGSEKWWQSPSLQFGSKYEWVTITIDLKQVYQVAYVILKSANSPRPGNWILERSVDGRTYQPWQYYAESDAECSRMYQINATRGRPSYNTDNEIICTSYYSKLNPFENGEIHSSLIVGRPGARIRSRTIEEFTRARFVRLRLQKILTLRGDLMALRSLDGELTDPTLTRRSRSVLNKYFYSIKDISIGGSCACYGHARACPINERTGTYKCDCLHNTCGNNCNRCCALYNQIEWKSGTVNDGAMCEKCQCYGHATSCRYDKEIAARKLSVNTFGKYEGGGVCINCQDNTMGYNCETCKDGYYRPSGVARESKNACQRCNCRRKFGSTGECMKDDSRIYEGLQPGSCICKPNYAGRNCDRCAKGYKDYPSCIPCYCNYAGTKNWNCDLNACTCKKNVEGSKCDRCKIGSFYLHADNPEGCSECFCFGVTNKCASSELSAVTVKQKRGWMVTDLSGAKKVASTMDEGTSRIADEEMGGVNMYYWQAPRDYLGQKIQSYGGKLKFGIKFAKNRGDTSGVFLDGINVILEGRGVRLGYDGGEVKPDVQNTFVVPLWKHNWFKLDENGDKLSPVSKAEMMAVLYDVDRLLLRARYHTDQIEGILNEVAVDVGSSYAVSKKKMHLVERCECPPGYTGLSCQKCLPGYWRANETMVGGQCIKCNCNNHAERCDPDTGACINCLHNTVGKTCERCDVGFYGNALMGTPNDCKPCACPLTGANSFSNRCKASFSASGEVIDYICTDCIDGYIGDKCQKCSEGFFGNPLAPGNYCQPCDCSNNTNPLESDICDSDTGECLKCIDSTAGWRCEVCKEGFYGNALLQDCRACNCNSYGSLNANCNSVTGKCTCHPNYVGDKCDRCANGYGSISEGCRPCNCNPVGSLSSSCNPESGICECKPGVFGTKCDSCMEGYYGFSMDGCKWCGCDRDGSNGTFDCNEVSGQCVCKDLVVGRACDRCTTGYWGLRSKTGCKKCNCNMTGSISMQCDDSSGNCECKPGVGGEKCDRCLPGYYGWSFRGCRKCARCDQPGKLCDPRTGECVCPPNTRGDRCQLCQPRTYGYDRLRGCKPCDCDVRGSVGDGCDPRTGRCRCLKGVEGEKCDKCQYGYFNFPSCRPCNCNPAGTLLSECRSESLCQCDEQGQCPCKIHTTSRDCGQCKPITFSLSKPYENGCYGCFCYGKSLSCRQGQFRWGEIVLPVGRQADIDITRSKTIFNVTNGLKTIPEQTGNIRMGISTLLDTPLYWSLPKTFLGDRSLSYNGLLKFKATNFGHRRFSKEILQRFPLVQIQGNWRLILEYHAEPKTDGSYEVKFREDFWKIRGNPHVSVTRPMMMVTLQNVQHLLIRATTVKEPQQAIIESVSLQHGIFDSTQISSSKVIGLEVCQCPPQYVGASCQDPAEGYYRKRKNDFLNSKDILDLVGVAAPCECNGRSEACDKETGICYNCRDNTTGSHCELCSVGFYGNPNERPCRPCACPLISNSFSNTCVQDGSDYYCTNCQPGYTGRYCHQCADGYYGDPGVLNGRCLPCACDQQGSLSPICNKRSGQCTCKEGITGRDCTICKPRYVITKNGCESCDDDCAGLLLRDVDYFMEILNNTHISGTVPAPWQKLLQYENRTRTFRLFLQEYENALKRGQKLVKNFNFDFDLESLANLIILRAKEMATDASEVDISAKKVLDDALIVLKEVENLIRYILEIINQINSYGMESLDPSLSITRALEEAERILLEIKMRDFDPNQDRALRELRKAISLLERMKRLIFDRQKLDELRKKLSRLRELIQDMVFQLSEKIKKPTQQAQFIMRSNSAIISRTQVAYDKSENLTTVSKQLLTASDALLKEAKEILRLAKLNYEELPGLHKKLVSATRNVRRQTSMLTRLNPIYRRRHVIPAQLHAAKLMNQAAMLSKLFQATRDISEYPLRAAKVYQNIIDALVDAMAAARNASEAAENAHDKAFPDFGDSLIDKASRLKAKSRQLLEIAKNLRDRRIPDLKYILAEQTGYLDETELRIQLGLRDIAYINRALDGLPIGTRQSLLDAIDDASVARDYAYDAGNRTATVIGQINSQLIPKLRLIQSGSAADLGNISKIIDKAREDVKLGVKEVENLKIHKEKIHNIGEGIRLDLEGLRRKILRARQTASTIKVSLANDNNGKCMRVYQSQMEPAPENNIVVTYSINSAKRDALLFFIGSKNKEDFMSLEMVDRKIRFSWNTGGKLAGSIQHNLTLQTNDKVYSSNSKWYKIEIKRFRNMATLSVQQSPTGAAKDPYIVKGYSDSGHSIMDLDSNANFYIGQIPSRINVPSEVKSRVYSGCMYELKIDGKDFGLWNFKSTQGCSGCKEGSVAVIDYSTLNFKGEGYLSLSQISSYQSNSFTIALHFKTYNDDSLLFLNANSETGEFVSVELRDGIVIYQFHIDDKTSLILSSLKKYNTGSWTKVIAQRSGLQGLLSVDNELLEGQVRSRSISTLNLGKSRLYFGGVPPTFNSSNPMWKSIGFNKFLGCMKGLQMDTTPLGIFRSQFYDIYPGCRQQDVRSVGFKRRSGFVEMNSFKLGYNATFGFTFSTKQADALLLLSTFVGKRASSNKLKNFYSVSLINGKIEARFSGSNDPKTLKVENILNDNIYHSVMFYKSGNKVELRLNDEPMGTIQLDSSEIDAPLVGGLYLGGVPPEVITTGMTASDNYLQGTIKDISFGEKVLSFQTVHKVYNADIGRPEGKISSVVTSSGHGSIIETCATPISYSWEAKALRFGDSSSSGIQKQVPRRSISTMFDLKLDFRTFHTDGLIFILRNTNRQVYLMMYLKNGKLHVDCKTKTALRQMIVGNNLNNGKWQSIKLIKKSRKLELVVGNIIQKVKTGRKLYLKSTFYFGSMPSTFAEASIINNQGFKGCIRNFQLNNNFIDLVSGTVTNVGQCFSRVESGAYFAGDAYAVYENDFAVGSKLELAVEFRTTKLNGVLFSVSETSGMPAFSVELTKGNVSVNVRMGYTAKFGVTQSFSSKYSICDGKWHGVKVMYSKNAVSLRVDGETEQYGFSESTGFGIMTNSPLYIGGLAGNAPQGSLIGKDNFVGCLRNLYIRQRKTDWNSMAVLKNVLPNACPAS